MYRNMWPGVGNNNYLLIKMQSNRSAELACLTSLQFLLQQNVFGLPHLSSESVSYESVTTWISGFKDGSESA